MAPAFCANSQLSCSREIASRCEEQWDGDPEYERASAWIQNREARIYWISPDGDAASLLQSCDQITATSLAEPKICHEKPASRVGT